MDVVVETVQTYMRTYMYELIILAAVILIFLIIFSFTDRPHRNLLFNIFGLIITIYLASLLDTPYEVFTLPFFIIFFQGIFWSKSFSKLTEIEEDYLFAQLPPENWEKFQNPPELKGSTAVAGGEPSAALEVEKDD
jgi:uncharacterized protein YacL